MIVVPEECSSSRWPATPLHPSTLRVWSPWMADPTVRHERVGRRGGGGSSRRGGWPCSMWWLTTTSSRREARGAREGGVRRGWAAPLLPPLWTSEEGHEGGDAGITELEGSVAFGSATSGRKRSSGSRDHAMDEPIALRRGGARSSAGESSCCVKIKTSGAGAPCPGSDCLRRLLCHHRCCRGLLRGLHGVGGGGSCVCGGGGGGGRE